MKITHFIITFFLSHIFNAQTQTTASQCELKSQSTHLNAEELMSPKQKNQSTSPNLPLNETIINEEEVKSLDLNF